MENHILTRAALGATMTFAAILPLNGCGSNDDNAAPAGTLSRRPSTSSESGSTAAYKDGTYTAKGIFGVRPTSMTITITLADGTITATTVKPMPESDDTSRGYQEHFAAAVPDEVKGKNIDKLKVRVIAGASGCSEGFNDALNKIRQQATASE